MRIIEYTPDHFDMLYAAAQRMTSRNLLHRGFVNHYYASSRWARLYLLLSGKDEVVGTIGIERMPFRYGTEDITAGFATNYHSLEPGAGGFLYLHWMKNCPMGISLGASEFSHNILRSQRWPYFDGVGVFLLNKPYETYHADSPWKRAAKWIARQTTRRRIASYSNGIPSSIARRISVQEETVYSDDLLPIQSPFALRLAPGADYLAWRYNTQLPFVRYRAFRIIADGRSSGYVILNENSDRLLVSQCDAESAETLAWGVLSSLLKAAEAHRAPHTVMLTCCHPEMQKIYKSFGFKMDSSHPLAMSSLRGKIGPPAGSDTSNWLINFDWGDNGLMELLTPASDKNRERIWQDGKRDTGKDNVERRSQTGLSRPVETIAHGHVESGGA